MKKVFLTVVLLCGVSGLFAANINDAQNIQDWFVKNGCSYFHTNNQNVFIKCKDGSEYVYKFSVNGNTSDDGLYKVLQNGGLFPLEKR